VRGDGLEIMEDITFAGDTHQHSRIVPDITLITTGGAMTSVVGNKLGDLSTIDKVVVT
jgi:hypothetical protein